MRHGTAGGAWTTWKVLSLAQLRESPGRLLVTVMAIALGVALAAAVYLVDSAALNEFGLATKRLIGEADIIVRGPREGFSEALFTDLARDAAVSVASPVLELDVALPGRRDTLKVLGVDPFRAAALQPALMGDIGTGIFRLFEPDSIYLSSSAAHDLHVRSGDTVRIVVGSEPKVLHILGILSESTYSQPLGLMDIAAAQWTMEHLGRLNRIDLRIKGGHDIRQVSADLARKLPIGVVAVAPQVERDRAVSVTRAYRVNLNMLALVALWTGAFLVFSTQSLSVLRRRRALGLLRALGVTRGQLLRALLGEGAVLGLAGASIGIVLGTLIAAAILRFLSGDLGNGQLHAVSATFRAAPAAMLVFFLMGSAVAALGAWMPARGASRQAPAKSLKGGDGDFAPVARRSASSGMGLLLFGAGMALLPPLHGLPLFGYASIGALLFGTVLLVPSMTVHVLSLATRRGRIVLDTAVAQLQENVGLSTLSLASIIVSFSLMVAMAIMVYSFRISFERWLAKLLPADIQLREPYGNDTAYWSPADQTALAAVGGIARLEFRRTRQLILDPARPPVALIARGESDANAADELPLIRSSAERVLASAHPAWISESLQDLYGYPLGADLELTLAGKHQRFRVAGIWRDYARTSGSVVISRAAYIAATGDRNANEGSVWLKPGAHAAAIEAGLRAQLHDGDGVEILTSTAVRERSLQIFDHAFAITYALEFIAVLIGLMGVSFAASSTALARRAEFGMLRHIGMLRRQVMGMLAAEGVLTSTLGVAYGLALGIALSLVLVFVVNRQSFNWSIDFAVPVWQLAVLSLTLIAAAAITALSSGRAAMSQDAVRAVREDW